MSDDDRSAVSEKSPGTRHDPELSTCDLPRCLASTREAPDPGSDQQPEATGHLLRTLEPPEEEAPPAESEPAEDVQTPRCSECGQPLPEPGLPCPQCAQPVSPIPPALLNFGARADLAAERKATALHRVTGGGLYLAKITVSLARVVWCAQRRRFAVRVRISGNGTRVRGNWERAVCLQPSPDRRPFPVVSREISSFGRGRVLEIDLVAESLQPQLTGICALVTAPDGRATALYVTRLVYLNRLCPLCGGGGSSCPVCGGQDVEVATL